MKTAIQYRMREMVWTVVVLALAVAAFGWSRGRELWLPGMRADINQPNAFAASPENRKYLGAGLGNVRYRIQGEEHPYAFLEGEND